MRERGVDDGGSAVPLSRCGDNQCTRQVPEMLGHLLTSPKYVLAAGGLLEYQALVAAQGGVSPLLSSAL